MTMDDLTEINKKLKHLIYDGDPDSEIAYESGTTLTMEDLLAAKRDLERPYQQTPLCNECYIDYIQKGIVSDRHLYCYQILKQAETMRSQYAGG